MTSISEALNQEPFTPKKLIESLKTIPLLKAAYEKRVRHYTIEEHTLLVMSEYEKYFSPYDFPLQLDKSTFRFLLAIHDIGKPIAHHKGDITKQHIYTEKVMNKFKSQFPITENEFILIKNVVTFDPIGLFLQDKLKLDIAVAQIKKAATKANYDINDFFCILSIYYQVDVASYTKDAGGKYFLEYLFTYNNNKKILNQEQQLLKFSLRTEEKFLKLKKFFK